MFLLCQNLPSFSLKPLFHVLSLQALVKSISAVLISPLYVLKSHNKVSLEPRPLLAELPQLSQPVHIAEGLQPWDPLLACSGLPPAAPCPCCWCPELEAVSPGQRRGEPLPWSWPQPRRIFWAASTHGWLTASVPSTGIPSLGRTALSLSIPSLHWYWWLSHSRFSGSLMKAKYDLKQLNIFIHPGSDKPEKVFKVKLCEQGAQQ